MIDWHPEERSAFRPPDDLRVSEWADRFRILDPFTSSEPGLWTTDRVPYAREWMDNANLPWVHQTTIKKSTQVGGTESLNNVLAFAIAQDPGPVMIVLPRKDDARIVAERRVRPMIRASPELRAELTGSSQDWHKGREIAFRRCVVYLRSAQTPAELASVPVRYLFGDECDKWPKWTGKEAPPWSLATERQRTFYNRIAYLVSTPTTRDGLIQAQYEEGDRRQFYVPCPSCDAFQVLSWKQVKWPKEIVDAKEMQDRRLAWYQCEHCGENIPDRLKREILLRGVWVPAAFSFEEWTPEAREEDRVAHRSYHIWAGYSPWLSWWEIVQVFLKARRDKGELQNFVNSWLGEVWEEKVEDPTPDAVRACRKSFELGTVPDEVLVVTAGVDTQKDRLPYVIRGWAADEVSFLLGRGEAETFEDLTAILFGSRWGAKALPLRLAMIDSRFRRDEVIEFCRGYSSYAKMLVGVERDSPLPFSSSKLDRHPKTGAPLPFSLTVWHVNVGFFKDLLGSRILATAHSEGIPPGAFLLPEDVDDRYMRHVSSEHKVRLRSGSKEVDRWILKPGRRRNDFWDCEVYALAAARLVRVDTLRSAAMQKAEKEASRRAQSPRPKKRDREGMPLPGRRRGKMRILDPMWGGE